MVMTATAALADDKTPPRATGPAPSLVLAAIPNSKKQNIDFFNPPTTDHGAVANLHFSFADTHVKMRDGGWSREVTQREMPIATAIAGVNMRLNAGGVRELHWHKEAEWSFMLDGTARITAVDNDGHNFVADVGPGDLWYFPSGIPHSIQGLSPDGCEFLLAFSSGSVFGGQHVLHHRHVRPHAEGGARQEFRGRRGGVRSHPDGREIHLQVPSCRRHCKKTPSRIRTAGCRTTWSSS